MKPIHTIRELIRRDERFYRNSDHLLAVYESILTRFKYISLFYLSLLPAFCIWGIFIPENSGDFRRFFFSPVPHIVPLCICAAYLLFYKRLRATPARIAAGAAFFYIFITVLLYFFAGVSAFYAHDVALTCLHVLAAMMVGFAFPLRPAYVLFFYPAVQLFFVLASLMSRGPDFYWPEIYGLTSAGIFAAAAVALFHSGIFMNNIEKVLALRESRENLSRLFLLTPLPSCVLTYDSGALRVYNPQLLVFYELCEADAGDIRNGFFETDAEWTEVKALLSENGRLLHYAALQALPGGRKRWNLLNYELIVYEGEKSVLCSAVDLAEIRKMEKALSEYAYTDALTGVYNRRKGMELLGAELAALRGTDRGLVLCVANIVNLKKVNDDFGHERGDEYIDAVCGAVRETLPASAVMFRSGGDAFAIILPDCTLGRADRLIRGIVDGLYEQNRARKNPDYQISVSFGRIFCDEGETRTPKQLLACVDPRAFRVRTVKDAPADKISPQEEEEEPDYSVKTE